PEGARDLPDQHDVVAAAHRGVEIDHLDLREGLEPPHPFLNVIVSDRKPFTLHELDDCAAFEIDRGDEHEPLMTVSAVSALESSASNAFSFRSTPRATRR